MLFRSSDQQIRLFDMTGPLPAQFIVTSARVPEGSFFDHVCDPGNLAAWQWRRTLGPAEFSPDGSELVFLGTEDCVPPDIDGTVTKPRTDILRVKVARVLMAGVLAAEDVYNVTRHPGGDVVANRSPSEFALTPDGATVLFIGTPTFGTDGNQLTDGTARQSFDRELYRMRLDGTNPIQLTNDLSFASEAPTIIVPDP